MSLPIARAVLRISRARSATACAEFCSTKALLAGDGEIIATIYRERVQRRGYGSGAWGWRTAYKETVAA